jgi:hypothetical protein
MTLVSEGVLREIYFGFNLDLLMLRIDTARFARADLARVQELRVCFLEPQGFEARLLEPGRASQTAALYQNGSPVPEAAVKAAVDQIVELTIPFSNLGLVPEAPIHMYVEAWAEGQSLDRAPREGALELRAPSADYELILWQA